MNCPHCHKRLRPVARLDLKWILPEGLMRDSTKICNPCGMAYYTVKYYKVPGLEQTATEHRTSHKLRSMTVIQ